MTRQLLPTLGGGLIGLILGLLLWGLILDVQIRRFEPGLWAVRAQQVIHCGLDYNGPPFTARGRSLWLTCGGEESGLQIWPPKNIR